LGKLGQKDEKTPSLVTTPQSTPNEKIVFFKFNEKTCWIRRWSEQLSSCISWRVMSLQTWAKMCWPWTSKA